jgi:Zn finger protein HypA/HybF involved in hydrogenase expression
MLFQQFKCQMCNHRFEAEVLDKDEPKERDVPAHRLRCPQCQSTLVEVLRTIERRVRRGLRM